MPPDPRVHCGVAVLLQRQQLGDLYNRNEVLLVHRAGSGEYASDGHGEWAMPGGWVDFGEDLTQTAIREVREETGIEIVDIASQPIAVVSCMSGNGEFQIIVPIMLARRWLGEARLMEPDKHSEVKRVPLAELHTLPLFSSTKRYFEMMGVRDGQMADDPSSRS